MLILLSLGVHQLFGSGLAAGHVSQLSFSFSFNAGVEQLALIAFIAAIICLTAALFTNPSILKRTNIERG